MFHETLTPLMLICFVLVAGPLSAADRLVDGVPLPGDAKAATVAETDPTELRQWAGAWVGAWGGTLKHVLLVESVTADGLAQVVYAIGDNPPLGIRQGWSRHEAALSGRRLTISEAGFSATYDLNDQGGLNATYTRAKIVSHAAMTKTDLTTLSVPDAVIPWTHGKSEPLRTALIEDGNPVNLEVVRLAGDDVVVGLLLALSRVGERNSAEIARVMASYFRTRDEFEPVSRDELLDRLRSGTATVLDVRPEDEFAYGHLPDALNIPLAQLERRLAELPADREIVAYCRGPWCVLSFEAVALLRQRGYRVRRLEDGFPEWKMAGLPIDRGSCGQFQLD
jgi:ArsR family transcriptional regulator